MKRQINAVIFDLDGTLADSMWMWGDIDTEYLGRYGIRVPDRLKTDIEGMSFTETAAYFKEHFQIPKTISEIKQDWTDMAYDKYANEVPLKPGAGRFLDYLKSQEIPCGIGTSNSMELTAAVLNHHGILDRFGAIITGCMVENGKPAPEVYLKAAEKLQVPPEECLVFEDVPMGILAGKNAGMRVCAVADAFSADQWEEKTRLADYAVFSYDEVLEKIREVRR